MKSISIIGSTGSIGTQTLEVIRQNKDINVAALSCGRNVRLLAEQIREFRPKIVSVADENAAKELQSLISDISPVKVSYGMDGLCEAATIPEADIVVTAIVGMIGVQPTIAAINAGKDIALANKETLVTAGHIVMPLAKKTGVNILPVDSEHSAIFQSLRGNLGVLINRKEPGSSGTLQDKDSPGNEISRIILTASGGPFRGKKAEELRDVTVEQALRHPNWSMGAKITIDSATMMNKGLEVIEAKWLFDVDPDKIEVLVQPQSIIHSAVEYMDGAIIAQLGTPDMKLPIQYALYYPERRYLPGDRLDFTKLTGIITEQPDRETFRGLDIAYAAIKQGGNMPAVMNAANEVANKRFRDGKIRFLEIYDIIEKAMSEARFIADPTAEEIIETMPLIEEMLS